MIECVDVLVANACVSFIVAVKVYVPAANGADGLIIKLSPDAVEVNAFPLLLNTNELKSTPSPSESENDMEVRLFGDVALLVFRFAATSVNVIVGAVLSVTFNVKFCVEGVLKAFVAVTVPLICVPPTSDEPDTS